MFVQVLDEVSLKNVNSKIAVVAATKLYIYASSLDSLLSHDNGVKS
jgi:hypothetical protein